MNFLIDWDWENICKHKVRKVFRKLKITKGEKFEKVCLHILIIDQAIWRIFWEKITKGDVKIGFYTYHWNLTKKSVEFLQIVIFVKLLFELIGLTRVTFLSKLQNTSNEGRPWHRPSGSMLKIPLAMMTCANISSQDVADQTNQSNDDDDLNNSSFG